jgi:hypothetical protein
MCWPFRMVNFTLNSTFGIRHNFIWSLLAVYGAVQDEDKEAFVRELVDLAKDNLHLILIGRFQFIKIQP